MKTLQRSISVFTILLFFSSLAIGQVVEAEEDIRLDFPSCADWWEGACSLSSRVYRTGSVNIGSSQYADDWSKLQVSGNFGLRGNIKGLSYNNSLVIQASRPSDPYYIGSFIHMYGKDSAQPGRISINTRGSDGEIKFGHNDTATSSWSTNLTIKPNGKVIIGGGSTADPGDGFRLAVAEGIQTQQLRVCASANDWCDYVFEKEYERNSIEKVETFIKENKHLPNVPSAQEVEEQGINVAEMDATLLRQIEELWLHVIDLKKENETLKAELEALKK